MKTDDKVLCKKDFFIGNSCRLETNKLYKILVLNYKCFIVYDNFGIGINFSLNGTNYFYNYFYSVLEIRKLKIQKIENKYEIFR